MALDSCRPTGNLPQHPALTRIITPLNSSTWRAVLAGHPDAQFVSHLLDGIGFKRRSPLGKSKKNCPSAKAHPQVVAEYIKKEVALGRSLDIRLQRCSPQHTHQQVRCNPKRPHPREVALNHRSLSPKGSERQ